MQTLTVSVIDSLNLKPLENFISWVTVSSGLNRNFTGDKIAMERIWENEGMVFKKHEKMREKCFWQARIWRRGAELQPPFHVQVSYEDRKWKIKIEKNYHSSKMVAFFFLSNLLSWPQRRFSCYCTLPVPIILWHVMNLQIEEGL